MLRPRLHVAKHANFDTNAPQGSRWGAFLPPLGCSGKLLLDTEGVIFVQEMYNGRHRDNFTVQSHPQK